MAETPINLSSRKLVWTLGLSAAACVVSGMVTQMLWLGSGKTKWTSLARLFHLDSEVSIPKMFSVLQLVLASLLLAWIAAGVKHETRVLRHGWWALSAGFLYMAVDEGAAIHEMLSLVVRRFGGAGLLGGTDFSWVVIGAVLVLGAFIYFIPFLRALPRVLCVRFVVSGAVFVGGALGMELLGGMMATSIGQENPGYLVVLALEEGMEMFGVAMFVRALLLHLSETRQRLELQVV